MAANLAAVRRRIERAGGRDVEVVAVTKGFGPDAVAAAAAAGCRAIGENYAQELLAKRAAVEATELAVHFIGRLQTNKVRQLVELVDVWASIDRARAVDEVARRAPGGHVLIQVDATGEGSAGGKGGCATGDVAALVERARAAGLVVGGLMTVGPTDGDPVRTRQAFAAVRRLVDDLGLSTCSMGMTADLELAVAEGTTQVRVGTALFGERERA